MSDPDVQLHIDDSSEEFEQWRQNMLRWCRRMWLLAFVAQLAMIYLMIDRQEYAVLPNVITSAFVLLGARFMMTKRVLTWLRHDTDSS